MDKYLNDALWFAAERAAKDRSIESLRRILEHIEAAEEQEPDEQFTTNGGGEIEPENLPSTKSRIPHGTTAKVKEFIESGQLFEQFLDEILAVSPSFSPKDLRRWLERNHGSELRAVSTYWRSTISTLMKYYLSPESDVFKNIRRLEQGQYVLIED
ncbi:MAG: hypothetical protein ACO4CS_15275 [bacterium]